LSARLTLQPLPGLGSTTYVYALCALVLASVLIGLAALYRMVAVVLGYAERRSNFVAAVSHELKTPLTAIRMYGEMLRDGMVPSDTKRDEYYRHITTESERLSRLINNVLEFSRLEKGNREVVLVTGPVAPVVREVIDMLRPHVEEHGFELEAEIDPDLPAVRFERDALMQVLWNLADNAVKFIEPGKTPEVTIRDEKRDGFVRIWVEDNGIGIAAEHQSRIFRIFERLHGRESYSGNGIGLAIVEKAVTRMNGKVGVESAAGQGSRFWLELPSHVVPEQAESVQEGEEN